MRRASDKRDRFPQPASAARYRAGERGAAVVETAMTLLLLLTLIFGLFEAGRMMSVQEVVTNAAREGARLSVTPLTGTDTLPTTDAVKARVNQFLSSVNMSGATITVTQNTPCSGTGCDTNMVMSTVTVSVPYSFLSLPLLPISFTMTGKAVMRNETSA
jgi:Flp pilus assembly protein TadG